MNENSKPSTQRGRPHQSLGTAGRSWLTPKPNGGYTAGVWIRTSRGNKKQVTASGANKGAAQRNLQRKLETMLEPVKGGIGPTYTVAELAERWENRKVRDGHARRKAPLAAQTRWAYHHEISRIIAPAMGSLRLSELDIPVVESILDELEDDGISTVRARGVLKAMFDLAVRDGAMRVNPMTYISPPPRELREVEALDIAAARRLLEVTRPGFQRKPGVRGPAPDLHHFCMVALGTGARIGEILAAQRKHVDLDSDLPTLTISGTMVEPRKGYVAVHHRQETTKTHDVRTLILPVVVADMLRVRLAGSPYQSPDAPMLASNQGTFMWAANMRQRLRKALASDDQLRGTTPHTMRRTVASLIAYDAGLDAARMQLGHRITGSTPLSAYVEHRRLAPDHRHILDLLFEGMHK